MENETHAEVTLPLLRPLDIARQLKEKNFQLEQFLGQL